MPAKEFPDLSLEHLETNAVAHRAAFDFWFRVLRHATRKCEEYQQRLYLTNRKIRKHQLDGESANHQPPPTPSTERPA